MTPFGWLGRKTSTQTNTFWRHSSVNIVCLPSESLSTLKVENLLPLQAGMHNCFKKHYRVNNIINSVEKRCGKADLMVSCCGNLDLFGSLLLFQGTNSVSILKKVFFWKERIYCQHSEKDVCFKRKELATLGCKFFPFRVDIFKSFSVLIAMPKVHYNLFITQFIITRF